MAQELYRLLNSMLLNKGHLVDKDFIIKLVESKEDIERKLEALAFFHKETLGYKFNIEERIPNTIGKNFEDAKVDLRKLKREINSIKSKKCISPLENVLLKMGDEYIDRGEKAIQLAYSSEYISLIKRSMKRWELNFGSKAIDFLDVNEKLNIKTLNDCSYDMIEWDYIHLIIKLKRKGIKFSIKDTLEACAIKENLDTYSLNFMIAMSDFPYDFMKNFNRYMENKTVWTSEEMDERMNRAILRDGQSILS